MPDRFREIANEVAKRLGLIPKQETTPRFEDLVNVTAPFPNAFASYPENIDEMILGSGTKPPTGTYTGGGRSPVPISNEVYQRLLRIYPHIKSLPTSILSPDEEVGYQRADARYSPYTNQIGLGFGAQKTDAESMVILAHELAHAAQRKNFPTMEGYVSGRRSMHLGGDINEDETQAYAVEDAVRKRLMSLGIK